MALTRRPYPYPSYEGDDQFVGSRKTEICPSTHRPGDGTTQVGPWSRLHGGRTLSSIRREPTYFDLEAPRDSLDFALKAEYNNHREFLKDRHEVVLQKETLTGQGQGIRKLKNRTDPSEIYVPELGHPLRLAASARREDKNSVKSTISGHHTQTTNVGFSRKPDGGFYTS